MTKKGKTSDRKPRRQAVQQQASALDISANFGVVIALDTKGITHLRIEAKDSGEIRDFSFEAPSETRIVRAAHSFEAEFLRFAPFIIFELFKALSWKTSLLELDQETDEKIEKRNQISGEITSQFRDLFKELLMPYSRPPVMVNEVESKTEAGTMIQREYRATSKGLIALTASERERARIDFEERALKIMRILVRNRSGVTMLNIAQKDGGLRLKP